METIENYFKKKSKTWFLTGAAGFIGSNILEFLLLNNQKVIAIDNFSTGKQENLDEVKLTVGEKYSNLSFHEADILDFELMKKLMKDCDHVIHQAALGSVPRSIKNPLVTNQNNVDGTINIFQAANENGIKRVVYASSSSVYGDHPELPKVEDKVGTILSPYAASKKNCEIYADAFAAVYDIELVGLRYFNVFGKRQDPSGPYAAVIPKWTSQILEGSEVIINGDGETSRDFTFIENIVQLNVLAAITETIPQKHMVFNGAFGYRVTLNELLEILGNYLEVDNVNFTHKDFRPGDVRHSLANIDKAKEVLGYNPKYNCKEGLKFAVSWYKEYLN